ncbi:unnamed protein product [Rotaria sp. Silwood2]|nr:unnamed protein product [Rotaria sp. Silwood2]
MQYTIKCLQPDCTYEKVDTDPFHTLSLFIEDKTDNQSSTKLDSRVLHVRYINLDGLVQIRDIPFSSNDTIKLLGDKLQPSSNCCIRAIRINKHNQIDHLYSDSTLLSQINDEITFFYETVTHDPQHTNAFLFFQDKKSTHSSFIHPPTVICVPKNCHEYGIISNIIKKHLKNLLDSDHHHCDVSQDDINVSEYQTSDFENKFTIWCDKEDLKYSKLLRNSVQQETTYGAANSSYPEISSTSTTLEQCLSNLSVTEYMSPTSVWCCSRCGRKNKASKENCLVSTATVLVIQLKRFNFNYSTTTKVERLVKYTLELDMSKFVGGSTCANNPARIYDLVGVCIHSGSLSGGHTTAYVKHSTSGQWYYCNDSYTCPISENEVIGRNARDAYILFYVRRSNH